MFEETSNQKIEAAKKQHAELQRHVSRELSVKKTADAAKNEDDLRKLEQTLREENEIRVQKLVKQLQERKADVERLEKQLDDEKTKVCGLFVFF